MCIGVSLRGTDRRHVPPVLGAGAKIVVERSIREPGVVHPTRALASPSVSEYLYRINFKKIFRQANCGETAPKSKKM